MILNLFIAGLILCGVSFVISGFVEIGLEVKKTAKCQAMAERS